MSLNALDAKQVAAAIGRSPDWLYRNWKTWVRTKGFPAPIDGKPPLAWDAAHIYAWLDRELPRDMRAATAAIRAAAMAYSEAGDPDEEKSIADWRAEISRRLQQEDAA